MISKIAPAKINLYLHVTGKRNDGYHLLDSLFVFADKGDVIHVEKSSSLSLEITGPYADNLKNCDDNIIIKAAKLLATELKIDPCATIHLEKNLPIASGIGGGSSDAAATLLALLELWGKEINPNRLKEIALELGADVPSCLEKTAVQVAGIGEDITKAPLLPEMFMLLVNPNKPVSTPQVFKTRKPSLSNPMPFQKNISDFALFIQELSLRHNDLMESACKIEPDIKKVLNALGQNKKCALARMSGSGGTCFALFENEKDMEQAYLELSQANPAWWFFQTTAL